MHGRPEIPDAPLPQPPPPQDKSCALVLRNKDEVSSSSNRLPMQRRQGRMQAHRRVPRTMN